MTFKFNNLRTSDKEFYIWVHQDRDNIVSVESQDGKIEEFTIGSFNPKGEYQIRFEYENYKNIYVDTSIEIVNVEKIDE